MRTDGAPRTRQPRGEERRRAILQAVLRVIARAGAGAVTTRSVAEEARVPLGSVSYYFGTKRAMLEEAMGLFVAEETGRLRVLGEQLAGLELPVEDIAHLFARALDEPGPTQGPSIAQHELYLEAGRDPVLRESARDWFAAYEEIVRLALQAAGAPPHVMASAPLFVALADGVGLRRLTESEDDGSPDLADGFLALYRGLLEAGPAT